MGDVPVHSLIQQLHAKPVSGEHLEVLGKQASAGWTSGKYSTLTAAVTESVKHAHLSPEQVRRVIEFANTDAFLKEFKKEGAHKVVDFNGGPADPSEIMKDLNDGGGGSVFDAGTGDYNSPPDAKIASASADSELQNLFGSEPAQYPYADPYEEVISLRDKVAGVYETMTTDIDSLEIDYSDAADRMYFEVKQACLGGMPLGHVVQAWAEVAPSAEHVKVAFQVLTPRLLEGEIFWNKTDLESSLQKTAGEQVVNQEHPLLETFQEYCTVLNKLAEMRATSHELRGHLGELTTFLKHAAGGGLIGKVVEKAEKASEPAGKAVGKLVTHLAGDDAGSIAKTVAGGAVKYAPHAAGVLAANEAYDAANQSPTFHSILRHVPGTNDYRARKMGY